MADEAYFDSHARELEEILNGAVNDTMRVQPHSLTRHLAQYFAEAAAQDATQNAAAALAAKQSRAASATLADTATRGNSWTVKSWLDSLNVTSLLADVLLAPLGSECRQGDLELRYIRALTQLDGESGRECVLSLLRDSSILGALADRIWSGVCELADARAAHAGELHDKFCAEGGSFTMSFSGLSTFFGGLEALVGAPNPCLIEAMRKEHCVAVDSQRDFVTPNYGITTTSQTEWLFVTDPLDGLSELGLADWPSEQVRVQDEMERRQPLPLSYFDERRAEVNARLAEEDVAAVGEAEFVACRLYTGPL